MDILGTLKWHKLNLEKLVLHKLTVAILIIS
jgi:hypothetical protein